MKTSRVRLLLVLSMIFFFLGIFCMLFGGAIQALASPNWDDPYWDGLDCLKFTAKWNLEDRPAPNVWLDFPGWIWVWVNGRLETHTFSYNDETGIFSVVRPLKFGDTVTVEGILYTSPDGYTGHLPKTTFQCTSDIVNESFAYTLTSPGEITVVWVNPEEAYPTSYFAYVSVKTDQGMIETVVPYVQKYGNVYYYSKKFCTAGRIVSAQLRFLSTVDVYVLGNTLDGRCRHSYLPLLER